MNKLITKLKLKTGAIHNMNSKFKTTPEVRIMELQEKDIVLNLDKL